MYLSLESMLCFFWLFLFLFYTQCMYYLWSFVCLFSRGVCWFKRNCQKMVLLKDTLSCVWIIIYYYSWQRFNRLHAVCHVCATELEEKKKLVSLCLCRSVVQFIFFIHTIMPVVVREKNGGSSSAY